MNDDFTTDDIDRWQKTYKPQQSPFKPGVDTLENGVYDLQIQSAELAKTSGENDKPIETIFRLGIMVAGGPRLGHEFEMVFFFRNQNAVDRLGGDLLTLGHNWDGSGAGLKALCPRLRNVRFCGKKSTTPKKDERGNPISGEFYHNLNILSLSKGAPMPQRHESPRSAPQPAPAQPAASSRNSDSSIPF